MTGRFEWMLWGRVSLNTFGLSLVVHFRQPGGYIGYLVFIGDAVGSAICGAIWTNTVLKQLEQNLPESAIPDLTLIYERLLAQLSYPVGSLTRDAIVKACGSAQIRVLASGAEFMGFIWVAMTRNLNVKNMGQTKGTVF
ncbi:siderochrome-iron transporter MirB [Penicillium antarcticum]|uniref:siderochrome-iron transporter MirB n=1 Tax=Penicillium antarcticum TaxID=416450 RepID=UPI002382D4DE|nr:siderochrome-iron transporter MirB [Penicillium antarcticum]KAJ5295180.1 siderochrome-iron transporter MirB [Penicillium antarcticum]